MDAEVQPEQNSEKKEPPPGVTIAGMLPPADHAPDDEPGENRREDVGCELDGVFPECPTEGKCQRSERSAGGRRTRRVARCRPRSRIADEPQRDQIDEAGRGGGKN